jgi:formylglycine-generating enzyme required for sulfatase activity
MIDRLIAMLQQKDLLLSDQEIDAFSEAQSLLHDEDIADALWLASKISGSYKVDQRDESENLGTATSVEVIDDTTAPVTSPPVVSAYIPPTAKPDQPSIATPEQGLPIQVQAAPALAHPRDIGRSLRPLMRKMPSLTRSQLDEIATVNRIAERDIWLPILKPSPERWFDLELVIESTPFSFIWQETLDEFQHLLECQGAFRNVRTWSVEEAATGQPRLVTKKQQRAGIESDQPWRSHKELVDASGRRLVLFVSDCRSRLWRQGQIHDWLTLWSQHGPAAIVQLLPERLWSQSELDVGFAVQVGSLLPGAPNQKLQVRELPIRTEIAPVDRLTVPIVTLTANALKQWALVVAAAGRQRSPARLFDLSWVKDPERDRSLAVIRPKSAQERVELFMATASPLAQRLARLMAAVPVELPVVHLIQQELLKDVQPIHIAEVYSSGLLEAVKPNQAKSDILARYDFVEGVRGLLNETTPLDETLGVLEALSQRIARTLGFEIRSFTALLSPKSHWSQKTKDAILPFAQIATEVLYRLGGDYAELVQLVEDDAQGHPDWIQPIDPSPIDPQLQVLDFTTAQFVDPDAEPEPEDNFPQIQTKSFTITTITIEPESALQPFDFTVATLSRRKTGLFGRRTEWVIQRQQHRAYRLIESLTLTGDVTLEMVAISGGTFLMGSPRNEPDRDSNEAPQHEVTVEPFLMGRFPITQTQWQAVATQMPQVNRELNPNPSKFKAPARPVENVNWYEAVEFCDRLNRFVESRLSHHTGRIYRLPTEAEWEYACRAGTTTPFNFGETITSELANYNGTVTYNDSPKGEYRQETTPVDHFAIANPWGLSDMHGNVWEWCQDHWHGNYERAPIDGRAWLDQDPDEDAGRVLRGGSWYYNPRSCRSANRYDFNPRKTNNHIGFRVVCLAPGTFG